MNSYYIKFSYDGDDVFLSRDGNAAADASDRCRLDVTLPDNFRSNVKKREVPDFRSNVIVKTWTVGQKNKSIVITVHHFPTAVLTLLEALKDAADEAKEVITLTAVHPTDTAYDFAFTGHINRLSYPKASVTTIYYSNVEIEFTAFDEAA